MRRMTGIALLIVALGTAVAAGEVREVPSRIERVSLFKNGLCVVHRVAELPGAGEFMLGQSPEPVHGTYFVTSDRAVLSRVVPCTVRVAADGAGGFSPSEDLAGQHVRIVLRDLPDRPVEGLVVATGREGGPRWDRRYEQPSHSWYYAGPTPPAAPAQTAPRFLTLQTDGGGRVYVDPAQIALIETAAAPGPVERIRPRLVLTVAEGEGPLVVRISYLAKGLAWAPAYQVDLTDPQRLGLRQSAVIRNELEDLQDVEVELVSGFPSMVFSHVLSPLAADTTWSAFFQQLNQRFQTAGPLLTNVATQMAYHGESGPSDTAAAALVGERADLHYQPIGRITLAEGESLHLDTAAADAPYERIVEWNIPDTRDEYGAHYRDYQRQQRPELGDDEPWDAVRFTNPFAMPMTTAAATMVAGGRFLGQQMSMWVNPGQRTSLRITKALSITARHGEQENADDPRDYILLGGKRFRQIAVQGTVELTNRRDRPVTMVIRRRFSGQLQTADAEPELTLLEGGVYSVNQRNELTWEIDLAPKEVRTLTYRYQVYVYH